MSRRSHFMNNFLLVLDSNVIRLHGSEVGEERLIKDTLGNLIGAISSYIRLSPPRSEWHDYYREFCDDVYYNLASYRNDYDLTLESTITHFLVQSDGEIVSMYERFKEIAAVFGEAYSEEILAFLTNIGCNHTTPFTIKYVSHDQSTLVLNVSQTSR